MVVKFLVESVSRGYSWAAAPQCLRGAQVGLDVRQRRNEERADAGAYLGRLPSCGLLSTVDAVAAAPGEGFNQLVHALASKRKSVN